MDALVVSRVAPLLGRRKFDVIRDFVARLPTGIASIWLGVPEEDRERITGSIFPLVSGHNGFTDCG